MNTSKTCYLFLDYDGTVFLGGKSIPPETRDALAAVQRVGHQVILNTGRSRGFAPKDTGIPWDGVIFGGADYTYRGERHCEHRLDPEEAEAWYRSAIVRKYWVNVEGEERFYHVNFAKHEGDFSEEEIEDLMRQYREMLQGNPLTKLSVGAREINGEPTAHLHAVDQQTYLELFPEGMDKGAILEEFCDRYGIDREQCIAFGDSRNDLAAFRFTPTSVSMKGSPEELEALATYRATTDLGVAEGIRHYFPAVFS